MTATNEDVPADRLIVTTRILEAPRELVWKMWTDPQHLAHWWGPTGFSTTTDAIDVRVGGQWRFTMHGPDGTDYKNLITFLEVNAPSRLVYKHGGEVDLEPVNFQTTVTFEAMPGEPHRTRLTMRAVFPSAKAREFVTREYNAVEGGKQHLARLAERVEALASKAGGAGGSKPFTLQRVVKAPRELVWKVWTQREHLAQWFGPKGCKLTVPPFELKAGAVMRYAMDWEGHGAMHGKWVFRDVQPPQRLEFLASFADARGNTSRHPMAPTWPLEMLSVVTFDAHAGKTHGTVITLQSSAWQCSAEEQRTFDDGHVSMTGGWGGTFEMLESYLAKLG